MRAKRDYHREVWTALDEQLERLYVHDPDAKGFGVYCVFWLGDNRPTAIPAPPKGMMRPQSAEEMERMLVVLTNEEARRRLRSVS